MPVDFGHVVTTSDIITGLGYSYSKDPDFRFCKLNPTIGSGSIELAGCGMSGGASGGPWILDDADGTVDGRGVIISVNSYGPAKGGPKNSYMGGPKLSGNSASCLQELSTTFPFANVTANGVIVDPGCTPRGSPGGGGGGGGGDVAGPTVTCEPASPIYCSNTVEDASCCGSGRYRGCPGGIQQLCNAYRQRDGRHCRWPMLILSTYLIRIKQIKYNLHSSQL
jgi:hypothetical protein